MKRNVGVDIDAVHHRIAQRHKLVQSYFQHCAGPCEKGTKPCPSPEACQQPDDLDAARGVVYAIPAALLAWAVIALGVLAYKFW